MDDTLKKYLREASSFMSDETISEGAKVDKDAAAVVIATEGDEFKAKGKKAVVKLGTKGLPKKPVIKEEGEEDADADKLEEEEDNEDSTIEEEETEDGDSCNEDEDDGAEDGEICEEDEGKEEGDEMADDDQIEDPKKKKMDIKESYIAKASHWM
jgi:hypothetical protein